MRMSRTLSIEAPIERVFDCWADLERASEHQKPVLERTQLTDGPVGEGTRFSALDQWPGRKVSFEMEITTHERPGRLAARWDEPMNGSWNTRFRSEGDVPGLQALSKKDVSVLEGAMQVACHLAHVIARRVLERRQ